MWSVDVEHIIYLRDGAGVRFTKFLDALLQTHGYVHGVGEAHILTCQRTNLADGGVDTQVTRPMPGEWTGFLNEHPTCWQYKARKYAEITDAQLLAKLDGDYVVALIQQGYAYRLAVCDDMPADKRSEWNAIQTSRVWLLP